MRRWIWLLVAGMAAAAFGGPWTGRTARVAYPQAPPPAHTGGFGEPTCRQCHFDLPLNDPEGRVMLEGLPGAYEPGALYRIEVILVRPEMKTGGFEMAVRFEDGTQAGQLVPVDKRVGWTQDTTRVEYVSHTIDGTTLSAPDTARWTVAWTAPAGAAPVRLHVAANAANDDASEFGDYIYVDSLTIRGE